MSPRRVLVADGDALARWPIADGLRSAGFDVVEARTAADALVFVAQGLDLALIDASMAEADGGSVLARVAALDPDLTRVALLQSDLAPAASAAARSLAFECVIKPLVMPAALAIVVRGVDVTRLRRDLRTARDAPAPSRTLVGDSPAMQRVRALVERYARASGSSVLITGEAGTGKRAVAGAIHDAGGLGCAPLVLVPCAAMPDDALEGALFGTEAGTLGPRVPGAFDAARDGTVVLTSIDRLPVALQARVLQIIEARTFRRAGGTLDVATDARVIASVAVDLEAEVRTGRFRGDLFYRLSALHVDLPPLRARREDVGPLARHFSRQLARELDQAQPVEVRTDGPLVDGYAWPGNARELRHLIEGALRHGGGAQGIVDIAAALLAATGSEAGSDRDGVFVLPPEGVSLEEVERGLVVQALARTGGNQTKAAALLAIHRDQIRYRIGKFRLRT